MFTRGTDGLDAIDWRGLRTADGFAGEIPEALRHLAAADGQDDAQRWYWRLDNHVILQGSLYEAAYAVIPFVVAIVGSNASEPARVAAYDLLVEIARGTPGDADHAETVDDAGRTVPLDVGCRDRIRPVLTRAETDLIEGNGELRRRALDLLVSIDADPDRLRSLLRGMDPGDDQDFADQKDLALSDLDEELGE